VQARQPLGEPNRVYIRARHARALARPATEALSMTRSTQLPQRCAWPGSAVLMPPTWTLLEIHC